MSGPRLLRAIAIGALSASLAALSLPGAAHAQSGEAALAEARERFREGLALSDAGNDEASRLKFSQAWALFKSPPVLFNLARSEMRSGHNADALEHFRTFAAAGPDPKITDAQREKVRGYITELQAKVSRLQIIVPAGALVKLDGKLLESVSEPVPVEPGAHTVEAASRGRSKSVKVTGTAGVTARVEIGFEERVVPPPPPDTGGGNKEVPPEEWPKDTTTDKPGLARFVVPGAIGVVGLAGIGIGIGYGLASRSSKDRVDGLRAQYPGACGAPGNTSACDAIKATISDVDSNATASKVGYIVGGALVAGAVLTYLLWPKGPSTGTRVGIAPSPGGFMLSLDVVR